jgi:cytochrome c5
LAQKILAEGEMLTSNSISTDTTSSANSKDKMDDKGEGNDEKNDEKKSVEPQNEVEKTSINDESAKINQELATYDLIRGEKRYKTVCFHCHDKGLLGSPKLGDKENWTPRIAQGMEVLLRHAIQGFKGKKGVMPPKGGQMHLPDEEIEAAVAYMVSKVLE